jgi:TRAP-type transport system periplasmic protein
MRWNNKGINARFMMGYYRRVDRFQQKGGFQMIKKRCEAWGTGMVSVVIFLMLTTASFAQQKVPLTVADQNTADSVIGIAFDRMAELANKSGVVEMKVFHGGVLGQEREMIEQTMGGVIAITIASPGNLGVFESSIGLLALPFLYRDVDHVRAVVDGPFFNQINDRLIKNINVRSLMTGFPGFRFTYTKSKPILSIEDFKGMKIRVPPSDVHVETFKALGANPTPIAFGEIYTSLQTGVIEGMENINEYIYSPKLHEQLKFCSKTGHMFEPWQIIISEKIWQKMSDPQRQAVKDAAVQAWKEQREKQAARNIEYENKLKEAGMKFNDINRDPLRQATEAVRQKLAAKVPGGPELVKEILAIK